MVIVVIQHLKKVDKEGSVLTQMAVRNNDVMVLANSTSATATRIRPFT